MIGFHKFVYVCIFIATVYICINSEATRIWLPLLSSTVICLMYYCMIVPVTCDITRFNVISWVGTMSLPTAVIE